tara:strand:- start:429 stop:830 length:402 start_codon:yes stop_codon:yes gene_type:complete
VIIGIGTDICDIKRISQVIEKYGERFKAKTFTEGEQAYCESKAVPENAYAKRFAAKEAVAKALAGNNTGALSWTDVEVRNHPSGRPEIVLHGTAQARLNERTPEGHHSLLHISLSDDPPYAQAFAIVEAVKDD